LPSTAQQTRQRELIYDLMYGGIWDDLDVFYNFYTDGSGDFAKINWKAPGTFQAVASGNTFFTPNSGFDSGAVGTLSCGGFNALAASKMSAVGFSGFADVSRHSVSGGTGAWSTDNTSANGFSLSTSITSYSAGIGAKNATLGIWMTHWSNAPRAYCFAFPSGTPVQVATGGVPAVLSNSPLNAFVADGGIRMVGFGANIQALQQALYDAWNKYKSALSPYNV
jgi:hypothetical protein